MSRYFIKVFGVGRDGSSKRGEFFEYVLREIEESTSGLAFFHVNYLYLLFVVEPFKRMHLVP